MGRKRLISKTGIQRTARKKKLDKLPKDVESMIQKIVEEGMDKFREELETLSGKEYVDRMLSMLEYVMPKISRVEKTGADDNQITINMVSTANDNWRLALPPKTDEIIEIGDGN